MILAIFPVELILGNPNLLLDAQVLVAHVLDLDGDVTPGPFEGEGNWVVEVMHGINVVSDGLEFLLSSLELG